MEKGFKEKLYEEVGTNYRFFLGWRHATLAGILVILYGVGSLTLSTYNKSSTSSSAWIIPALSFPIGFVLWIIDFRTRQLYIAAINAGKHLEGDEGGFFTELVKIVKPPGRNPIRLLIQGEPTQSSALDLIFIGSSLFLLIAAVLLYFYTQTASLNLIFLVLCLFLFIVEIYLYYHIHMIIAKNIKNSASAHEG
jgi:hypothetical protein